jgi:hypothetical protein
VEFAENERIVDITVGVKLSQYRKALFLASLDHEPPGALWEHEGHKKERYSGYHLEAQRKTPLQCRTEVVLRHTVADPAGNERADAKEKLLERGQTTADGRVG